jgi:1,4-dihydroxy-6-naphthoate synthase
MIERDAGQPDATLPGVSLGISPCPNDVFIFAGLLLGAVDDRGLAFKVVYEDVESLNDLAGRGRLDVAKISYANYVRIERDYELLPCGGALGRGVGPLLLTGGRSFDPSAQILVPGEHTTANFLLDFYLAGMGRRPQTKRFLPFDALYGELCNRADAQGVVIHEKRFTYEQDGLYLVRDLGDYWEAQTGYVIPLGAIAVRRSLRLADVVAAMIRDSLAWAEDHRSEALALCRRYAQDLSDRVIEAHIGLYVNAYSRDLGDGGAAAVEFFLRQQRDFQSVRDPA